MSAGNATQWVFGSGVELEEHSADLVRFSGGPAEGPRLGGPWGPFLIGEELGRGATACVYRVTFRGHERALKVLLNPTGRSRQRIAREARLVGRLEHPGIVTLHGAGAVGDFPFLLYELIPDPRDLSAAWGGLPLTERVDLVARVASAVGYAHSCGVIHRDLKPANVLVDQAGNPRVVDFGLATDNDLDGLTRSGSWLGTPSYMSPEQFESTRAGQTPAVDVWSLGVLLYEALTERLPFRGASVLELAARVRESPLVPPSKLDPQVPRGLEAVCMQALSKSPERRYANATEFAVALRVSDRALPRRSPWPWIVGAGVFGVGLTLFGLTQVAAPPQAPPPTESRDLPLSPFANYAPSDLLARWGSEGLRQRATARLEIDAQDHKARLSLALSNAELGDYSAAYQEAKQVHEERPSNLLAIELLASSSHNLGDPAAAEKHCREGLALDRTRYRLWQILAVLATQHRDGVAAVEAAQRALDLEPDDAATLGTMGLALATQDDHVAAIPFYDRSLELEDSPAYRYNRAASLMYVKSYPRALADCEALLVEDPSDTAHHCLKLEILRRTNPQAALSLAVDLERRFPQSPRIQRSLGGVYALSGRSDKATAAYHRALQLDPYSPFNAEIERELQRLKR